MCNFSQTLSASTYYMINDEKSICIVLVDDDSGVNFLNEQIIRLSAIPSKTFTFLEGEEALSFLNEECKVQCDAALVLLDLNMPKMNGWEFIEQYRRQGANRIQSWKLAVLTSSIDPAEKKQAEELDEVHEFISKPLTVENLKYLQQKYFAAS